MTAVCALAATYWQLLLLRIGVGIGEAGTNPPSHSIIADLYTLERRSTAMAIFAVGPHLGVLLGFLFGGLFGRRSEASSLPDRRRRRFGNDGDRHAGVDRHEHGSTIVRNAVSAASRLCALLGAAARFDSCSLA